MNRFLPRVNSAGYYVLLACVAIFLLGPLGGITAAYMNFSLGFFVGGQVLAGILGSAVTFGYGPEGKHGANYMQTMAASVAGMAGMAVLIQAMVWLGLPEPPAWHLILYFLCIGMFGCGVGMLYTPILVDRMQLIYPSGYAVANILRALTDIRLLRRSIRQLVSGTVGGFCIGLLPTFLSPRFSALYDSSGISAANLGAGMIVGCRIAVSGAVMGLVGVWITPFLVSIGWLKDGDPFRKIGFIIALGMIMGAAIVDLTLIFREAIRTFFATEKPGAVTTETWAKRDMRRLIAWVVFWGIAVVVCATQLMHTPLSFTLIAIALVFLFVLVNGISQGISDQNPISSAFVITIFVLAACGLTDAGTGLMAASILLICTSVACDMQQDRSTGWRLGTNRTIQFRYQVIGIVMGACMSVGLARLFMRAYPILRQNQFGHHVAGAERWGSAMTYKFVGALDGLTHPSKHVMTALTVGVGIGLVTEIARKILKRSSAYSTWVKSTSSGYITDLLIDCAILPSPYASSFGGFVEFPVTLWYAGGGVVSSVWQTLLERGKSTASSDDLPEDMSVTSLVGGGFIAGDSLAALGLGIYGLVQTVL